MEFLELLEMNLRLELELELELEPELEPEPVLESELELEPLWQLQQYQPEIKPLKWHNQ
jgi:hypothetical protein